MGYVSLSKVESVMKLCPFVDMAMVYGRTGAKNVVALIMPQKPAVLEYAEASGIQGSFAELCANAAVIKEVSKACLKECKAGGLLAFEIPAALSLVAGPDDSPAWSPDNGLLTSTLKLKRPLIAREFAA